MICTKCGKTIADGAKFCAFCGAVQNAAPGGAPYGRGGDAFGSRGGAPGRGGDVFGGAPGRGGDVFGGAPRRGGDAFGGAPRRGGDAFGGAPGRGGDAFGSRGGSSFGRGGGYDRPARKDGGANFILLLIGAILAAAGGIVRLCMNITWKDSLKSVWDSAKMASSFAKDEAVMTKVAVILMILYHALPGLLIILFAVLVITAGRRRPVSTGTPTIVIPVVEFILPNVIFIWGIIEASSVSRISGGEIFKAEMETFFLPVLLEIVFAVVYFIVVLKLSNAKKVFIWIVPILGAVSFVYMLVLHLIYKDEHIYRGFDFMINGTKSADIMYLVSFALFFAGACVAVFGFPRNGGRLPGPGMDSRDPYGRGPYDRERYARGSRDSFGRY